MKKILLLLTVVLLVPHALHAQGGCVDSPECPTAVLALVGSAAIAVRRIYRQR